VEEVGQFWDSYLSMAFFVLKGRFREIPNIFKMSILIKSPFKDAKMQIDRISWIFGNLLILEICISKSWWNFPFDRWNVTLSPWQTLKFGNHLSRVGIWIIGFLSYGDDICVWLFLSIRCKAKEMNRERFFSAEIKLFLSAASHLERFDMVA